MIKIIRWMRLKHVVHQWQLIMNRGKKPKLGHDCKSASVCKKLCQIVMKIDPFHCLRFSLISLKLKQSVSCIRQSERVIKNRPWIRDVQTRIKAQKSTTASKYFLTWDFLWSFAWIDCLLIHYQKNGAFTVQYWLSNCLHYLGPRGSDLVCV